MFSLCLRLSLRHRVQTGSAAQPASYPMSTRSPFLEVKRPEREAYHSPTSSVQVKNSRSYTSTSPLRPHGVLFS